MGVASRFCRYPHLAARPRGQTGPLLWHVLYVLAANCCRRCFTYFPHIFCIVPIFLRSLYFALFLFFIIFSPVPIYLLGARQLPELGTLMGQRRCRILRTRFSLTVECSFNLFEVNKKDFSSRLLAQLGSMLCSH